MRALIHGLRYDTDAAEEIAGAIGRCSPSDLCYYEEALYLTDTGTWFLAGHGNAMTKYAQPYGEYLGKGDGIVPLSPDDARSWLEFHGMLEVLEDFFPDDVSDA